MTESSTAMGPLEPLLSDPGIHTIMVNGYDHIFVSRQAFLIEEVPEHFRDQEELIQVINHILSPTGRVANESNPILDIRLQDWTLLHIVMPPVAPEGPIMTIQKAISENQIPTFETLVQVGSLTEEIVEFLRVCVAARANIVVCGATGSGKTTLLNLIANLIPPQERIILVEKQPDLILSQNHVVKLSARPANAEGKGEITLQQIVESAARLRPDRIVCSEVSGAEAYPLLHAMSSGVEGSLFALHATSPRDALARLEVMVTAGNPALPLPTIRQHIARAVNVIVELEIMSDGWRRIQKVTAVTGLAGDFIQTGDIFEFVQTGVRSDGTILGEYVASPNLPIIMARLRSGDKRWGRWAVINDPGNVLHYPPPEPPVPPVPPPHPSPPHMPHIPPNRRR